MIDYKDYRKLQEELTDARTKLGIVRRELEEVSRKINDISSHYTKKAQIEDIEKIKKVITDPLNLPF